MDSPTQQLPGPDPATDPATHPATDPAGPRITGEQARDFSRLRRSRTDRYVGGVAGGLGRHFDVDPVLVRVVLLVLAFFGGAGLLVYAAIWLLVPADDQERAPLELGPDVAKVLVVVAAVVAGLTVLGVPWLGGDGGWIPWPLILVAVLVTWLVVRNRDRRQAPPPAPYDAAPATQAAAPGGAAPATAAVDAPTAAPVTDAPPAAAPPAAGVPGAPAGWGPPPPPLPPRPRRTGTVLFWPTLAAIAVALGVLGLVDASVDVPLSAYAALALAVTGGALLLGAFRSRPGGLIALGLVGVVALGATSTADAVDAFGPYGDNTVTPTSAAEVERGTIDAPSGGFTLDLSDVSDPAALDGRTIRVRMDVGQLVVELPPGVAAEVDGEVRWAGEIVIEGQSAGDGTTFGVSGAVGDPGNEPTVRLDLELGAGQIDVWRSFDEPAVP